jgi:serine/threonine protein kinase
VDARADIYGLGCTLYFLLTGHPPFVGGTLPQRLIMHRTQQPPSIRIDRPDAPIDLVAICEKMLAKRPEHRYQSALEAAEALAQWLRTQGRAVEPVGGDRQVSGSVTRLIPPREVELIAEGGPSTHIESPNPRPATPPVAVRLPPAGPPVSDLPLRVGEPTTAAISLADTVTGVEAPTLKRPSPRRRGPPALPKSLPVARPLDDSHPTGIELEAGGNVDQRLLPERPSEHFTQEAPDPYSAAEPSSPSKKDLDLAAYFARRRGAPAWLWFVAAAGAVLAAAMALLAWKMGWLN